MKRQQRTQCHDEINVRLRDHNWQTTTRSPRNETLTSKANHALEAMTRAAAGLRSLVRSNLNLAAPSISVCIDPIKFWMMISRYDFFSSSENPRETRSQKGNNNRHRWIRNTGIRWSLQRGDYSIINVWMKRVEKQQEPDKWMSLICFASVDLPDSPAPRSRSLWIVLSFFLQQRRTH